MKAVHHLFEVVTAIHDVMSKVLFAVPLAHVSVVEVVERIEKLKEVLDSLLAVLLAHFVVAGDFIESFSAHTALAVEMSGESLEVLKHQFGVVLVGMYSEAEVDKLVVVVEGREVHPQAAERAAVILGVGTAVDGRFTVEVRLVVVDSLGEFGDGEVQFVESLSDCGGDGQMTGGCRSGARR